MTDKTFSGGYVAIEYEGIQEYFSMNYYVGITKITKKQGSSDES